MANVTIQAKDGGSFSAYLATPKGGTGPGIVVIQEIFGVNDWVRRTCDALAAKGFTALAPDLFWRIKPGIELTASIPEEFQQALKYMGEFDQAKGIQDIQASITYLRSHGAANGKVGAVGYCLGGRLAYMTAAGTDVDASVGYYGVGLQGLLGDAGKIKKPLILDIAEKDSFTPPDVQKQITEGLKGNPLVTIYLYAGADHGFARDGDPHYHPEAAELANRRTEEFFKKHLA
jgi:carboxymethylenebutenolidase